MEKELKKAVMLLKSLILHYHGLDEDERLILEEASMRLDSRQELEWANSFISRDYLSAFERAKEFFSKTIVQLDKSKRLAELTEAWEDNHKKGYVTEMETTAMIHIAQNWKVEQEFLELIKN